MIRLQYAINASKTPTTKNADAKLLLYASLYDEQKKTAINGTYVTNLFDDVKRKTGGEVSINTRKRIMGQKGEYNKLSSRFKQLIVRYLELYCLWSELEENAEKYYYKKKMEYDSRNTDSSLFVTSLATPTSHKYIHLSLLLPGDRVKLDMGDSSFVHFFCKRKGQFEVTEVKDIGLRVGDLVLSESILVKGNVLAFERVMINNEPKTYIGAHKINKIVVEQCDELERLLIRQS